MSGPKVVRMVTREERIHECQAALARFDRSAGRWRALGERAGQLDEQDVKAMQARREALQALLDADRYDELLRRVPQDIAFLKDDMERRRQRAADAAAETAARRHRLAEHAAALRQQLRAATSPADASLLQRLAEVQRGELDDATAEGVLARGFLAMGAGAPAAPALSEAQRELAARLAHDAPARSFEQWKAARAAAGADPRLRSIERHLAELTLGGREDAALALRQRLGQIDAGSAQQRNLRLDSLVLDLAAAVEQARREAALLEEAQELASELMPHAQADDVAQALAGLQQPDMAALPARLEAARAALMQALRRRDAEARRKAVLDGLASLGYAVQEGMQTAWTEQGRLVLRKPALPGYGVEIGGAADAERLQVRAVALSGERDSTRDRDAETAWCGDFSQLQQALARHGHQVVVERALPVGAAPLKVAGGHEEAPRRSDRSERTKDRG